MNEISLILFILILTISILVYLIYKRKKATNIKAGKQWEGIVKELSRRK